MRFLKKLCAVILGSVLFVAGLLKLMDPVGASLVVEAYLKFLHIPFLEFAASALGSFFALVEACLGAAIVTGVWKKVVRWIALGILAFFTVLTLLLVIFNPQMDCGCFGEAIHLTHFQSLIKNLAMLALWAVVFVIPGKEVCPLKTKKVSFLIVVFSTLLFAAFFRFSLPAMDFTSYKVGCDIRSDEVLSFSDESGDYCDEMAIDGDIVVVSIYNPDKFESDDWIKVADFTVSAKSVGCLPLVLCYGNPELVQSAVPVPELFENMFFADRKELMTLNRSNGGAVLICDGQIVSKWSCHNLPDAESISGLLDQTNTETISDFVSGPRLRIQAFLLYAFAVMLLL